MNKISDIGLFIFILFKNFGVKTLKSKYNKDVYTFIPCRAAKKKGSSHEKAKTIASMGQKHDQPMFCFS